MPRSFRPGDNIRRIRVVHTRALTAVATGLFVLKRPGNSRSSRLKIALARTQMIPFYRSRHVLRFSNSARALRSHPPRSHEEAMAERPGGGGGSVAGIFQPGVYQRRRELCFGLCQRAPVRSPSLLLSRSVYTTGPISMRTTKRGRGPLASLSLSGLLLRLPISL